jgi:Mrp family chromosome partitioning ATPase
VVPSGALPPNPSELLSAQRTAELLAALREDCDIVLVDSPPLLPVTDATALSVWVEATVLVTRAHATRKPDLQRAAEVLVQGEAPLVGSVLNDVQPDDEYSYASSYYYKTEQRRRRRRRTANGRPRPGARETLESTPERLL